jgi:hypothetical protein
VVEGIAVLAAAAAAVMVRGECTVMVVVVVVMMVVFGRGSGPKLPAFTSAEHPSSLTFHGPGWVPLAEGAGRL